MSLGGLLGGGGGIGGLIGGMLGGPLGAMLGQMFEKVIGQVMTQAIDDFSQENKMSGSTAESAKKAVCEHLGEQDGGRDSMYEMLGDFQKKTGASDADMGTIEREIKSLKDELKKLFNEMNSDNAESTDSKKKKAAAKGGENSPANNAGDTNEAGKSEENSAGIEAGDDWFIAVAKLLGKAAQKQAEVVKDKASKLSQATDAAAAVDPEKDKSGVEGKKADAAQAKAQVEATAQSQKMGSLMEGVMTAIKSLGQALQTAARSQ